jgi:hypothetical protein
MHDFIHSLGESCKTGWLAGLHEQLLAGRALLPSCFGRCAADAIVDTVVLFYFIF